jgi:hypothetical protein
MASIPESLRPHVRSAREAYKAWCAGGDPDDAFALEDDDELRASQFVRALGDLRAASKDIGMDSTELETKLASAFPLAAEMGLLDPGVASPRASADVSNADDGSSLTTLEGQLTAAPRSLQTQEDLDDAYPGFPGEEYLIHRFARPFGPSQLRVCERGVVWVRAADGQLNYDLLPFSSLLAFEYQELRDRRVRTNYLNIRTVYGSLQATGTFEELSAIIELISTHMP